MIRATLLTAAVLAAVPAAASADTGLGQATSFKAAFTTHQAGRPSGLILRTTGNPPAPPTMEPPAVRQTVTFPAGTKLRLRALSQCHATDAQLAAQGAAAVCPRRVGSGRAEGVLGGKPVGFDLAVYAVRGKLVFAAGKQSFDGVAHGRTLALSVPTLNGAIAPTLFRAKIDHQIVRTPRTCRRGGWKFGARFQGLTAVDGSPVGPAQHISYRQRCA